MYPVVNSAWVYYKPSDGVLGMNTLYEYIQYILKDGMPSIYLFYWDEYKSVTEFFLRFNYDDRRENSDPWGREFKAYRVGYQAVKINGYESRAIIEVSKQIPKMYVTTTSVEGDMIYCVDVMSEVL